MYFSNILEILLIHLVFTIKKCLMIPHTPCLSFKGQYVRQKQYHTHTHTHTNLLFYL